MQQVQRGAGQHTKIYGLCVICGERVKGESKFITTADGYCHKKCLKQLEVIV